jgi:hypothetical protein
MHLTLDFIQFLKRGMGKVQCDFEMHNAKVVKISVSIEYSTLDVSSCQLIKKPIYSFFFRVDRRAR